MILELLNPLFAFAPPPSQPGAQPNPTGQLVQMLGMFALMGVIFYFLLIRPQRVRTKQHEELLKTIKRGDKIVTNGGIVGVVITANEKDKTITFRSADAKMEILKSAVTEILERSGESGQSNA